MSEPTGFLEKQTQVALLPSPWGEIATPSWHCHILLWEAMKKYIIFSTEIVASLH